VAANQAQITIPPPPCMIVGMSFCLFFKLICCVLCSLYDELCMTKCLHFGLVCPMGIVPEGLCFVQMQLYKPKLCCRVPFRKESFSWRARICSVFFLIVLSWALTFNMVTEACRVWDVTLFFAVSLRIACSAFVVNLLGRPHQAKPNFHL